MTRTEFRYNKKRKHYSYIYSCRGDYRQNLLISSKPDRVVHKDGKKKRIKNIKLSKHPNPNKNGEESYLMTKRCLDHKDNFGPVKKNWFFSILDRLKVKKVKKGKCK